MLDNNYERVYEPIEIEIQTVLLPNRHGDKNYLLFKGMEDDKYTYELRLQFNLGIRLIFGDGPEEVIAIDPPGGPMIGLGYKINTGDLTLELIEIDKLTLKFKEYVN
jgi:hypothetical protein